MHKQEANCISFGHCKSVSLSDEVTADTQALISRINGNWCEVDCRDYLVE